MMLIDSTDKIIPPKADKTKIGVLEATYTDAGRSAAGPLTAKATVKLRKLKRETAAAKQLKFF